MNISRQRKQAGAPEQQQETITESLVGDHLEGGVASSTLVSPAFYTLEETSERGGDDSKSRRRSGGQAATLSSTTTTTNTPVSPKPSKQVLQHMPSSAVADSIMSKCPSGKKLVSLFMSTLVGLVVWDATMRNPDDRWIRPQASAAFLAWVQEHPVQGLVALLVVIACAVVLMIPVGTPLTLGCGYIYKGAYGWKIGLTVATAVSMGGSALGAVICFLLGRYLMRDQVRTWIRKYPLFDAIDIAAGEHGLRIMAMLYLTPILPLGPVSYMCGTTSMALSSFVLAKIASLPLMLLYCFIGASTGALIGSAGAEDEVKSIEENQTLIVSGILLSLVMITCITHHIKKELNQILERQKNKKHEGIESDPLLGDIEATSKQQEDGVEMGLTKRRV